MKPVYTAKEIMVAAAIYYVLVIVLMSAIAYLIFPDPKPKPEPVVEIHTAHGVITKQNQTNP